MSEDFNMSMRKFLKQVGVTSQQAIEQALRDQGTSLRDQGTSGKIFKVRATITIEELGLTHEVTGDIKGQD